MKIDKMLYALIISISALFGCGEDPPRGVDPTDDDGGMVIVDKFYFGADLSYVNQILDHGGVYSDNGSEKSPYEIFSDHGANLIRLRLWHNPTWTMEVYGQNGTQLYNDLQDVERAIEQVKNEGLEVLLDFHYSDDWADPGKQFVPEAWREISDVNILADSVYEYTKAVLTYLKDKGLGPEMVQLGNEINCGFLLSGGGNDFPEMNVCDNGWSNMAIVSNKAIQAVREVSGNETKIAFHVADPKNVGWWFDNFTIHVSDFDIIGISYYPLWHTTVQFHQLEAYIEGIVEDYGKEVILLETAYPWTTEGNDNYNNLFGGEDPISGYPYTVDGQKDYLVDLTQALINAGASGLVYWEPAWITSDMKDQWGTGSSWENNVFFDFEGNTISSIDFMTNDYEAND